MPTYEYKCPKCLLKIELQKSINDEKPVVCFTCGKDMVKGFGGGSAVHFKGSGWYETDYKGK